jgi:hypothetical protein
MVPTRILPALLGAALLLCGGASMAAEYRADEFLGLDLSKAVLSPNPLGPATGFAPVPVQAKGDVARNDHETGAAPRRAESARAEPKVTEPKVTEPKVTEPKVADVKVADVKIARFRPTKTAQHRSTLVAHARLEKPKGAARTRLAHRHSNPLDAQAFDTRIQAWPCKSGGICDWKQ